MFGDRFYVVVNHTKNEGALQYTPTLISRDCEITNGNIVGDASIEFTIKPGEFEDGEDIWIGGWTAFDDSNLRGFKSMSKALKFAMSMADERFGSQDNVRSDLLKSGCVSHGDGQEYIDVLLIPLTLPNGDEKLKI